MTRLRNYPTCRLFQDEKVLVQQVVGTEERFHLARYWRAEEGIVTVLEDILAQVNPISQHDSRENWQR